MCSRQLLSRSLIGELSQIDLTKDNAIVFQVNLLSASNIHGRNLAQLAPLNIKSQQLGQVFYSYLIKLSFLKLKIKQKTLSNAIGILKTQASAVQNN